MIRLSPGQRLIAFTAEALASGTLAAIFCYSDQVGDDYLGSAKLSRITGTTPAEVVTEPGADPAAVRDCDTASITNQDAADATVSVCYEEASVLYELARITIPQGGRAEYSHAGGWRRYTADGSLMIEGAGGGGGGGIVALASTGVIQVDSSNPTVPVISLEENSTHRFTTDAEKAVWNAKQPALGFTAVPDLRTVAGHPLTANITLSKGDVGLPLAENTADLDKPVSTLQAAADAQVLTSAQAYADGLATGVFNYRTGWDASGGLFPSTGGSGAGGSIKKANLWTISVAGTLGGQEMAPGDTIWALVNAPGQTPSNWAYGESNLGYVPTRAAVVPNTAPTSGQLLVGTAGGAYAPVSLTGDASISSGGALTLATVNSSPGTFTNATVVVDAKGRAVAVTSGTGGGAPASPSGSFQGNTAGAFAAIPGWTYDPVTGGATYSGGTVTADTPMLTLQQTWNNGSVNFTGLTIKGIGGNVGSPKYFEIYGGSGPTRIFGVYYNGQTFVGGDFQTGGRIEAPGGTYIGWVGGAILRQSSNTTIRARNGQDTDYVDVQLRNVIFGSPYTVATLPSEALSEGHMARVADLFSLVNGSTAVGGGSSKGIVVSNGINWIVLG